MLQTGKLTSCKINSEKRRKEKEKEKHIIIMKNKKNNSTNSLQNPLRRGKLSKLWMTNRL